MFRKVADVKREKELAEKRKNDPPLELSSDHPVRKLISRFRKMSDNKQQNHVASKNTNAKDPEKGESTPNNLTVNQGGGKGGSARLINVSENGANQNNTKAAAATKWGKFLAGATSTPSTTAPSGGNAPPNNQTTKNVTPVVKTAAKPVSKWGKLLSGKPQETIPEEDDSAKKKSNLRKPDPSDNSILRSDNKLDPTEEPPLTSTPNNLTVNQGGGKGGSARLINVSENGANQNNTKAAAATKWGKFLAGATSTPSTTAPSGGNAPPNNQTTKNVTPVVKTAAKPVSKWGKLLSGKPQETIPEEDDSAKKKSNLRKPDPSDNSILRSDNKLDPTEEPPLTQRDISLAVGGGTGPVLSPAEQQVIASLYDIKLDIKEEIETLNQKMTKIDDQIGDILKLFSPHSSPYSSHTPSSMSSRLHSSMESNSCNSSTGSNSMVTSPKGSVPSSPHRHALENLPVTSLDSSRTNTPPPVPKRGVAAAAAKGVIAKASSSGSNGSSSSGSTEKAKPPPVKSDPPKPPSPPREPEPRSESACGSTGSASSTSSRGKRKKSAGGRTKVAPQEMELSGVSFSKDDESAHIKDRDLDIL